VRNGLRGMHNRGVNTTGGVAVTRTETTPARLDRPVLVSNIVSGTLWLLPLAFASWPLCLIGAAYVAVGSVFLAAVYARDVSTMRQEMLAWATPWLVAVALWTLLLAGIDVENSVSSWFLSLFVSLGIGTLCYLAWQVLALVVRHVLAWRSRRAARSHH